MVSPTRGFNRYPDVDTRSLCACRSESHRGSAEAGRDNLLPAEPIDRELVREVWDELRAALERHLAAVTLEDLCQRKRTQIGEVMYYI